METTAKKENSTEKERFLDIVHELLCVDTKEDYIKKLKPTKRGFHVEVDKGNKFDVIIKEIT